MTQVSQTSAAACDAETYAVEPAEAEFVLAVQCQIQKLMHAKGMRARELSKRLRVTEARVSQMFGEQAKNLTLKTIARIFYHLGEKPHITTSEEVESALANWTMNGLLADLQMASGAGVEDADSSFEPAVSQNFLGQWIRADKADAEKPRRLAAVR